MMQKLHADKFRTHGGWTFNENEDSAVMFDDTGVYVLIRVDITPTTGEVVFTMYPIQHSSPSMIILKTAEFNVMTIRDMEEVKAEVLAMRHVARKAQEQLKQMPSLLERRINNALGRAA